MKYGCKYTSSAGDIILLSDGEYLTGLCFENQKYYTEESKIYEEKDLEIFNQSKKWLDMYFNGIIPNINLALKLNGTSFQKEVWEELLKIPYGKLLTYGKIADTLAKKHNIKKMSARAVGNAIGHNPIPIIVPCHRVIGKSGKLTGFSAGMEKKIAFLKIEGYNISDFT